jgi:hypothetical protein
MSTQIYEKFKKEEDEDEYIEYNSVTRRKSNREYNTDHQRSECKSPDFEDV